MKSKCLKQCGKEYTTWKGTGKFAKKAKTEVSGIRM